MPTTTEATSQLLATVRHLPPITESVRALLALSPQDPALNDKVKEIVETDAALAANAIRLANAAAYTGQAIIDTIDAAVMRVGARIIVAEILRDHLWKTFQPAPGCITHLWLSAAYSSNLCLEITTTAQNLEIVPETAYMHGLLHDVGRLVIALAVGPAMDALIAEAPSLRTALAARERELFGFDHAVAGRMLAANWKLPPMLVTVIAGHHAPAASLAAFDAPTQRMIALLGLVDELVHFQQDSGKADPAGKKLVAHVAEPEIAALCQALGLEVTQVQNAVEPAFVRIARQARLLGVEIAGMPAPTVNV